jgi:hypothetical protein
MFSLQNWIKHLFNFPHFAPIFVAATLILVTVITTILVMKNFSTTNVNSTPVASVTPKATPKATPMASPTSTPKIDDITEEKAPLVLEDLPAPKISDGKRTKLSKVNPAQQLIKEAEEKYLAAITILSKDAQKNYGQMSPELKASFDKSLRVIDENIAQTRRAIRQHPQDPVIAQYMLASYAKKVEVLQEIVTIDKEFGN